MVPSHAGNLRLLAHISSLEGRASNYLIAGPEAILPQSGALHSRKTNSTACWIFRVKLTRIDVIIKFQFFVFREKRKLGIIMDTKRNSISCMHRSNGQLHENFRVKAATPLLRPIQIHPEWINFVFPRWKVSMELHHINEFLMENNQVERVFKSRQCGLTLSCMIEGRKKRNK